MSEPLELTQENLKGHLKDNRYSAEWLFQAYVIQKRSHYFSLRENGLSEEMHFRSDIARTIGVAVNEVNIVGSAQVGFSIKPSARLRKLDEEYAKTGRLEDLSDIDVAIVSSRYFEKIQQDVHDFTRGFKTPWEFNSYYPKGSRQLGKLEVKRADYHFFRYMARGWIRPDFAPDDFRFTYSLALDKWKLSLKRKISIGIYREWKCLRDYQTAAFEMLREYAIKEQL